jgi:hypothetical protein
LSTTSIYYSKENLIRTTEDANNPEDRGLIDMPNVKLRIQDINDKRLYRTTTYKFSNDYCLINITLEQYFIFTKPTSNKQLEINDIADNFIMENTQIITEIQTYNTDKLTDLTTQQKLK